MELWLALFGIAFTSGLLASRVSDETEERILSAVVLGTALIMIAVISLALAGWLRRETLLLASVAAPVVVCGVVLAAGRASPWLGARPKLQEVLAHCRVPARSGMMMWGLMLAFFVWILSVWVGLSNPPFSYDSMAYHLRAPLAWMQSGHLSMDTGSVWSNAYPMTIESVEGWFVALGHSLRLGFLPNAVLLAAGGLAVYRVAERFHLPATPGIVAGLTVFLAPPFFLQMPTAYIDAACASLLFLALALLLSHRPVARWVGVVAAALAMGSKATALIPGFFMVLWYLWTERNRGRGMAALLAAAPVCLVLGGFWYFRDWIYFGNPFYPFRVGPFPGIDLNQAIITLNTPSDLQGLNPWQQWVRAWFLSRPFYTYDSPYGGLGLVVCYLGLPALVAVAVVAWMSAPKRGMVRPLFLLAACAMVTWALTPANWWGRYDLNLLIVPALAIAYGLSITGQYSRRYMRLGTGLVLTLITVQTAMAIHIQEVPKAWHPDFRPLDFAGDKLFAGDPYWIGEVWTNTRIGFQGVPFADALRGENLQNRINYVDAYDEATFAWYLRKRRLDAVAVFRDAPLAQVLAKTRYARCIGTGKTIRIYQLTGLPPVPPRPLSSLDRLSEQDVLAVYHPNADYEANKAFLAALAVREETDPGQKTLRLLAYRLLLRSGKTELAAEQRAILERYYPGSSQDSGK